jgi:uncharacterized radical SAM superfamily Fe-S cluster-containing enzyme
MFPINNFVNFDRFFSTIRKTAENAESKNKLQLLAPLFMGAMLSMNMLLVTKEVGTFTLMKSILQMHMNPSYKSLGKIRRRIFLLGCMAFMDNYNFDVNRVRRCVVHYITPDKKIIPFCAYNNVHGSPSRRSMQLSKRTLNSIFSNKSPWLFGNAPMSTVGCFLGCPLCWRALQTDW